MVGARTTVLGAALVARWPSSSARRVAVTTAWFGGRVDTAVSAGLDILFAFPGILLAVLSAAVFGPGLLSAGLALADGVLAVPGSCAARCRPQGAGDGLHRGRSRSRASAAWWLCFRHLLPNISGLIVAQGTIFFGFAIVDLAAISFLGLGVQSPQADWGVMVSEGKTGLLQGYPLESLAAVLCIVVVVSAVTFIGERLETASRGGRR